MWSLYTLAIIVTFTTSGPVKADQCAAGSTLIAGNWYCQAVEAIRYSNVGSPGAYKQIVEMNASGNCKSRMKSFRGPLSPLDEEVSLHFRGPISIKQFAAYIPARQDRRETHKPARLTRRHNVHEQMASLKMQSTSTNNTDSGTRNDFKRVPQEDLEQFKGTKAKAVRDIVTATINGQVVSWKNEYAGSQPQSRTIQPLPTLKPITVPAVAPASPSIVPKPDSMAVVSVSKSGASRRFSRVGYYDSISQTSENLVFLGNHGGQGSGVFDYKFGASLAYSNRKGTGGASAPQVLADTILPSDAEVIVMMADDCKDGSCGFVRPGAVAHKGFGGADKVFLIEFSMPLDGKTGFNADMPAIWMLNAQIPRTIQYGNGDCSCWRSGCGEFDIAETLSSGSMFMKSTLHSNTPGGSSDYLLRPTTKTMKLAVIFDAHDSSAHIQVLSQQFQFPESMTGQEIKNLCINTAANRVSNFKIIS